MRYRTLFLFVLMFASAVGAAVIPAVYDNLFPALLYIAFPVFTALMFTSIAYDIMYPRPAETHARLAVSPAPQTRMMNARPVGAAHLRTI